MGCASSKPAEQQPVENVDAAKPAAQPAAAGTAESAYHNKMSSQKWVKDESLMMCPYFSVQPEKMEEFSSKTEAFYKSAVETEDVLFYGADKSDAGVSYRQGYRSASALVSHIEQTKVSMSQVLETSQLDRVEVHGTRKQLMKVKRSTTTIEQTNIEFFETHPKMISVAKPTEFNGQMGSDKLISINVTLQVSTATELRTIETKVKCVHRRCIALGGNQSFFFSRCLESGKAKIVAMFDSMEDATEHVMCMGSHLGGEALNFLEMHGPEWMLSKIKGLLGKVAEGVSECASFAKGVLESCVKKAAEDALMAKACAEAAAKAFESKACEGLRAARDKTAAGLTVIVQKAKAIGDKAYTEALKLEGATEAIAKAVAKAAQKKAMEAVNDIRQASNDAAKAAYDGAVLASKTVAQACDAAEKAAVEAVKAAHDDLKELAEDAEAAAAKAKELCSEGLHAAQAEALALKLSVEIEFLEMERLLSSAAKEVRRALFAFYDVVKKDAIIVAEAIYAGAKAAKDVTEEAFLVACDKSKAAAYAVASASEQMYLVAYHKAIACGKAANEAKDASIKAAEYAGGKTLDMFKLGAQLCADALSATKHMLELGVQAVINAFSYVVSFILDVGKAIRRTLYKGAIAVKDMVHTGMMDSIWAVGAVIDAVGDALEGAVGLIGDAASAVKHHLDKAITMIPHFTFPEGKRDDFKKHAVSFKQVSVKTSDTLFYGVCHKEGGACIRQGYRSASSMVSAIRESETVMTEVTKYSTLQKVEVHGTRRQLVKVQKQMTRVSNVKIEFYESDKKIHSIRRATDFSGEDGSDSLVTAHLSMKVTKQVQKTISHKLRAVQTHARDHPHVHSFSITKCVKTGELKIMGAFMSVEAGMEHLSMCAMHLEKDILHTLEMHGPSTELAKVKGLMGGALSAVEGAAASMFSTVKGALTAACDKAEEKLLETKAVAWAVEKAAANEVTAEVESARDAVCETINSMQTQAEDMAKASYQEMMTAEKYVEDEVKDLSKQSYKAAMEAFSEIRQAADEAGRTAYEKAIAADASAEQALEDAHKAADAAASAMKEELIDAAEAAQAELEAVESGISAAEKKALEVASATAKAAADFAHKAVEAVAAPVAKSARAATLAMHSSLKSTTEEVVMVHYKKEVHSEKTISVVSERARAAAWSLAVTREETYYVTYEKHIIHRSGPEVALKAAKDCAAGAASQVVSIFKKSETTAGEAVESAKKMLATDEKQIMALFSKGVGYSLDSATALRASLYSGAHMVEDEISEATEGVSWAVSTVIEDVTDGIEDAHNALASRLKDWYAGLIAARVKGLRAVADAADSRADTVERKQKAAADPTGSRLHRPRTTHPFVRTLSSRAEHVKPRRKDPRLLCLAEPMASNGHSEAFCWQLRSLAHRVTPKGTGARGASVEQLCIR
eukprot:CAMPEP_0171169034 /NCGR_PEP_ID=MMETSP0790-20130122/8010_1 /TAXON_ID=2925 /ORGANISM="Alexandrium catenella, Strain OF101" /LENGTH=1420 /DNA_ID=CAMNT_0011633877 /DNA_START=80 /DNA_END=4339 /DNA_ORIENTATION=+